MSTYLLRKIIRRLPGVVIKAVRLPSPRVESGCGVRSGVGQRCLEHGYTHVLLVTDQTLASLGYHEAVVRSLEQAGVRCTLFTDIDHEPDSHIVQKGCDAAYDCNAQCIVALGGGSVMDASKMIAAAERLRVRPLARWLLRHGRGRVMSSLTMHRKFLYVPGGTLPLITIPSTAGTGAEITVGAVITDSRHGAKRATVVVGLRVTDVFLDSELTLRAPRNVTASCGIDALSHGLEGCVAAVRVSAEDQRKSRECVRLVLEHLPHLLATPDDVEARQAMCLAAHYGGNAINRQLAGYVHAFAHSIGAVCHIPHGVAIARCLMPVMEYQKAACQTSLAELAVWCGVASETDNPADAAERILAAIAQLIAICFPGDTPANGLSQPVIPADQYPRLIRLISKDSINYSAPVTLSDRDIRQILERI